MSKISFVYFDVGGVAIKDFSDTGKWSVMISDALGISPKDHTLFNDLFAEYEDDICTGKIEVDALQPFIKERFHVTLREDFSLLEYYLNHFEFNKDLWPIVEKVKQKVKVGLLTDQYLGMLDGIFAKKLIPTKDWNAIIDSSVVGVRKPSPEIYEIAARKAGVPVGEILFIDNRQKNLVGAADAGWQTYVYDSREYDKANQELSTFFSQNL